MRAFIYCCHLNGQTCDEFIPGWNLDGFLVTEKGIKEIHIAENEDATKQFEEFDRQLIDKNGFSHDDFPD